MLLTTGSGGDVPGASRASREEFSSVGGSYIKLGAHKNSPDAKMRHYNETLLGHYTAPGISYESYRTKNSSAITNLGQPVFGAVVNDVALSKQRSEDGAFDPNRGLRETKFGMGFQRKNVIENPAADEIARKQVEINMHKDLLSARRADDLRRQDEKNGFNPITHALRGDGFKLQPQGKRKIEVKVSEEIAANSRIQLRESEGRFHMPHASGVKHDYRQQVLTQDGIVQPRFSSVLESGKADLPSYGIEDNFGKSVYPGGLKLPPEARVGLYEMREAGKFTPRKQPNNPSGNAELVKNWGSGMDIANNTLRGRLK